MPGRGLEPLRISPPDPKSGASANSATLATGFLILDFRVAIASDGVAQKSLQVRSFSGGVVLDVCFEICEVATELSGEHHGLDVRTDFHGHLCGATDKRIEKYNTYAKTIGLGLPCDAPVGDAHYDLDVAFHFFAIDNRGAGEVCVVDPVDLGDGHGSHRFRP